MDPKDKEEVLLTLRSRPDNFRWTITGRTWTRNELIRHVEDEDSLGEKIAMEAKARKMTPESYGAPNILGKRYSCLVCGGQLLVTTAKGGVVECCNQPMDQDASVTVPSSD